MKQNNSVFNCKKLECLYNHAQTMTDGDDQVKEFFYKLDENSIKEMIQLRLAYKINDKLMPYFLMSYNTKLGKILNREFGKCAISKILSETWFSNFHEKQENKNSFFVIVPLFTSDLIVRISSYLIESRKKEEFYIDVHSYSHYLLSAIHDGDFYHMFSEDKKSSIGFVKDDQESFSTNIKNSIELFYFSSKVYLFDKLGDKDTSVLEIQKFLNTYLGSMNLDQFYTAKEIKSIVFYDTETKSIQKTMLKFIEKFLSNKETRKKENGAHQCKDGVFRKPTSGSDLIISKRNSSNTFSLVFLSLTVFTLIGTVALTHAEKNDTVFSPSSSVSNDYNYNLSAIVQNELIIKTFN